MTGQRIAGLFVALLMLHLNLVRADVACALHGAGHAAPSSTRPHPGPAHHGHGQSGGDQHHEKPCDTPTQADCCQALVSCSLLVAVSHNGQSSSVPSAHDGVLAAIVSLPLSPIVPPDPPPPKA